MYAVPQHTPYAVYPCYEQGTIAPMQGGVPTTYNNSYMYYQEQENVNPPTLQQQQQQQQGYQGQYMEGAGGGYGWGYSQQPPPVGENWNTSATGDNQRFVKRKKEKKVKEKRELPDMTEWVAGVVSLLAAETVLAEDRAKDKNKRKRKRKRKRPAAAAIPAAHSTDDDDDGNNTEDEVILLQKPSPSPPPLQPAQPKTMMGQLLEERSSRNKKNTKNLARIIRTEGQDSEKEETHEPNLRQVVVETAVLVRQQAQKRLNYLEQVKKNLMSRKNQGPTVAKAVRFDENEDVGSSCCSTEEEEEEWPDLAAALKKPKQTKSERSESSECRTVALHSHSQPWKVAVGLLHKLRGEKGLASVGPIAPMGETTRERVRGGRKKSKKAKKPTEQGSSNTGLSDSGWETVGTSSAQNSKKEDDDGQKEMRTGKTKQMRKKKQEEEQQKFLVLGTERDKKRAAQMANKLKLAIANQKEGYQPTTTLGLSKRSKANALNLSDFVSKSSKQKKVERTGTAPTPATKTPPAKPSLPPPVPNTWSINSNDKKESEKTDGDDDEAWPSLPTNPAYRKTMVEKEEKRKEAESNPTPKPKPVAKLAKTGGLKMIPAVKREPEPSDGEKDKGKEIKLRHLERGKQKEMAKMLNLTADPTAKQKKKKMKKRSRLRTVIMREVLREKERLTLLILEAEGLLTTPKEHILHGGFGFGGVPVVDCILTVPPPVPSRKHIKESGTDRTEKIAQKQLEKYLLPENPIANLIDPRKPQQGKQKHVREYVNQVLSSDIDDSVVTMMRSLQKFQAKLKQEQPKKYKARLRYVIGLKECLKAAQLKKLKAAFVVPDIQVSKDKGGLDDLVGRILDSCSKLDVPVVYTHTKETLGVRCFGVALKRTSCIGIYSADGANDVFSRILRMRERCCSEYMTILTTRPDLQEASLSYHKTSREMLEQHEKEIQAQKQEEEIRRRHAREVKHLETLAASAAKKAAKKREKEKARRAKIEEENRAI